MADTSAAFPTTTRDWDAGLGGMSLRAWFAGQALMGLCANPTLKLHRAEMRDGQTDQEALALVAYAVADAMVVEGSKSHG